jgi:DNA-binding transcriptional LysR family regulator
MRHLRFLHYVDTVARVGSIRKAATRLNIASSALNRRILDIEEELGVALFERRAHGVRLSTAGEYFVAYIRRTTKDLARARSEIQGLSGLHQGIIRISAIEAVAHSFLNQDLVSFRKDHPNINYTVTVGTADQVVASVVGGDSDIGISFNPVPNHQFRTVSKVRQRLCALMVRDHPLARYKSLRLTDCMAYPLAIPVQMLGGRRLLDEAMLEAGLTLNPVLEADNFEVMKQFIAETGGIALEIEIGAITDVAAGRLTTVPLVGRHLGGSLVLGIRLTGALPTGAALFCQMLAQRFDRMAPTVRDLSLQPQRCDAELAPR